MGDVHDTLSGLLAWRPRGLNPHADTLRELVALRDDPALDETTRRARMVALIRDRIFADYEDPGDDPDLGGLRR